MEPKFPMRINRFLANQKKASRREADELIRKRKVYINGKPAVLGSKVNENDKVELRTGKKGYLYYAYNKPPGETTGDQFSDKDTFPIGRLDKDSEGLMILTNDRRITAGILDPEFNHGKEYIVTVTDKLRPNFKEKMETGVNIEGYTTKPCEVNIIGDFKFRITLTEGKQHQIRRMCAALFNRVKNLRRVRIMNIKLADLKPGEFRKIEKRELEKLLDDLGIPAQG